MLADQVFDGPSHERHAHAVHRRLDAVHVVPEPRKLRRGLVVFPLPSERLRRAQAVVHFFAHGHQYISFRAERPQNQMVVGGRAD